MIKKIYLAGGCFWGVEAYYRLLKGVVDTKVGYANGTLDKPTYQDLIAKRDDSSETVLVVYDNSLISLTTLLSHMFRFIDPTSINKQGNDVGIQYRSGIYYEDLADLDTINSFLKNKQKEYSKKLAVEVLALKKFYLAEEYHQNYLEKNPQGYCHVDLNLIKDNEKNEKN